MSIVSSGSSLVVNNGTVNNTTVSNGGVAGVMTGGVMNTVNVNGGLFTIGSAGQANDVTLTDSASLFVQSAGKGNNINAKNGSISVASGANVSGVQVGSGAKMNVSKGGIASGITVSAGGTVGKFTQNAGTATIAAMNGSAFAGAVTGLNATGNITTIAGAYVSGGQFANGTFNVQGGTVSGLMIGNDGVMNVTSNAATIIDTKLIAGGSMTLSENTKATNTILTNGATLNTFTHVGTASATVASVVGNNVNGAVNGVVFTGIMNTAAGANLTNVTVSDGAINLAKDAKANNLTVEKGFAYIYSGAIASGINVKENGALRLNAGAVVNNVTLQNGGKVLDFEHTGSDAATIGTVTDKGIGGTVSNLSITGNANILAQGNAKNLTVCADGLATFKSNAKAESANIESDGTLVVENGAVVNSVTLQDGGNLNVAVGGSAVNVSQSQNGSIDLIVQGGDTKTLITGKNENGSFAYSSGVASNFIVYEGQKFVVSSGGSARNITAANGGIVSAALGADITGYSSDMNMSYSIIGGAISGLTNLKNFELIIESGYAVDGQTLNQGGVQSVASGGLVKGTKINSNGEIRVGYNGSALNVFQAAGGKISLDIYQAALTTVTGSRGASDTFKLEDSIASNFAISSGASMTIHSGGKAINSLIESGGKMVLSSGGNASSISMKEGAILSANIYAKDTLTALTAKKTYNGSSYDMTIGNGKANNIVLDNGGRLNVFSDASAEKVIVDDSYLFVDHNGSVANAQIKNDGSAFVEANGQISNVTIENNSELRLAAGAFLSGNVLIKGQLICEGTVSTKGNPVNITIDISDDADDADAAIRNISFIKNATYTVLVDSSTTTGSYKLAENALNFSDKIYIKVSGSNENIGYFSVDNNLISRGRTEYQLTENNDGELILTIRDTTIKVSANTTKPTNGSVTVRADFTDFTDCTGQYSLDNENWQEYDDTYGVVMPENGTVYFRCCTDDNIVITTTYYTVTNIDNEPPKKPEVISVSESAVTNKNVFVTAKFSEDSVTKEYSFDKENWLPYTTGVELKKNDTVYFRGIDALGNISEYEEYIDNSAPAPTDIKYTVKNYTLTLTWKKLEVAKGQTVTYTISVNGEEYTSKSNKFSLSKLLPGNYEYQVRGVITQKGEEGFYYTAWSDSDTAPVADNTKPKMSKVWAEQIDADSIRVNWDPATDNNKDQISKYEITYNNGQPVTVLGGDSYTFDNVNGTKAVISVKAYDMAGNESASKKVNLTIKDMIDPDQVTGVDIFAIDKYKRTFIWDAADDNSGKVAKYQVRIDDNENKYYTTSQTKISISNLSIGWHTIEVCAVDKAKNDGDWSEEFTFFVDDVTAPKMGKVWAEQLDADSIKVYWDPATDNNKDQISRYVITCNDQPQEVDGSTRFCTFDNVEGTKAVITVKAYDMANVPNESASKKVNLTIKDMIDPDQVTGVDIFAIDKYKRTFIWDAADDNSGKVAKYQVRIDDNENKYYTTSQTKISISNLSIGEHTIQVRAVDKAQNDGEWSEEFTFVVKDVTAPNTVSVKATVTDNAVRFTWKRPKDNADSINEGVNSYTLCYWETGTNDRVYVSENELAYFDHTISGLQNGKYNYELTAIDAADNSSVRKGSFNIKTELPVPALLELETTLLGPAGSDTDLTSWNSGGTQDTSIYDPASSSTTDLLSDDPGSYAADISSLASADVSTLFGLDEKQNSGSLAVLG